MCIAKRKKGTQLKSALHSLMYAGTFTSCEQRISLIHQVSLGFHRAMILNLYVSNKVFKVWQYGLSGFQSGDTELERFLPKNQHTERKL